MPDAPLRVLIVEDNPSDAKLLQRELQRGGLVFDSTRVETEQQFVAALETEPDVVLCDWNLPEFNSLSAIALLQERWPNTSFILVSGSIGEEAAVKIIKLGASDYLLKDRLARLVPAVEQALAKRAIQRSELRVKAALELSERQLREAQRVAKLGSWVWEPPTGHVWWSDALYELFGVNRESVAASFETFLELVHSDDRPIALRRVEAVLAGADGFADDLRIVTPDGRLLWIHSQAQARRDAAGLLIRMEGTDQDITERKRAEIALVEREAVYRLLADQMRDVVVLADAEGAIRYVSPSCEHLSGYTPAESLAIGIWYIVLPDDLPVVQASWARCLTGEVVTFECRCRHRDGHQLWMETLLTPVRGPSGSVDQVISTKRDVTARRVAEERLRQSLKLEAIGLLAGGVAHDFNNLLTVIGGSTELVLSGLEPDSPNRGLLEDVSAAADRGAALTRQLLAFSRQQFVKPELFDLTAVVRDSCKMLVRLIGEDVRLITEFAEEVAPIEADPRQLEQVLMNLIVNARDAMPRGGRLTISTSAEDVGEVHPRRPASCPPGCYVRLSVADTGEGMPPEVLDRIFEPFFTTKPTGKGTGLGLATVHGIVGQARGFVAVKSEVGSGTTFDVYFPKQHQVSDECPSGFGPDLPDQGTELVLLVEDEPAVRQLAVNALRKKGFQVVEAESGREALSVYETLQMPPALLVTDVVMPDMSGPELAEVLTLQQPRLKVLYTSGYSSDAVLRHGVEEDRFEFLQKPYSLDNLVHAVHAVLKRP